MRVFNILLIGLAIAFLSGKAFSQTTFATITGSVTDSSGAVVANADIVAINTETGIRTETKSNSTGVYLLSQLKEGRYTVQAKAPGFKEFIATNIELVARDARRVEVRLQIGDVGTVVEVSAGAVLIETETARLSDTKSADILKSLPLNSRGMYAYLALTPGLIATTDGFTRVGGSGPNQIAFAVDGTTMSDGVEGSSVGPLANYIESFQEVKVDMANNGAQFGTLGQITVISKSGTNRLHGSGFDYYITPFFRARNPFALVRQAGLFHTPGLSIGGPVFLPKLHDGRNRTFFFFSDEISLGSTQTSILNPTVPLPNWRAGNFAGLAPIYDPNGTLPFVGNQIPADRINAVSAKIQDRFFPLPNFGDNTTLVSQNYRENKSRPWDPNTYWTTRFDHILTKKDQIYGRFTWYRGYNRVFEGNLPAIGQRVNQRSVSSATVSETHVFSPTVFNELRWGYVFNNNPLAGSINGPTLVKDLGLIGLAADLPDISGILKLSFTNTGLTGLTQIDYANPGYRNFNHDIQDHISWSRGRHTLKFGFNLSFIEWDDLSANPNLFGNVTFSNRFTSLNKAGASGGHPYADFLLGIPTTAARAFAPLEADRNRQGYDFYAADDFKVNSKLTMNLGVRYELHPPWRELHNRLAMFDIGTSSIVVPDGTLGQISPAFPTSFVPVIEASKAGLPGATLVRADKNNFAPRFGLAYRPWGPNTVIRTGFGVFFDLAPRQTTISGLPFVLNEPAYTNSTANPAVVFPRVFPSTGTGVGTSGIPGALNPDLVTPYSMQYNFTIEHQAGRTGMRLSYVGTTGRKTEYGYDINSPLPSTQPYISKPRLFPQYGGLNYFTNGAGHQYNAFSAEGRRSLSTGLYFQASWTWARDVYNLERGQTPENPYDLVREHAVGMGIPTHRVNVNYVYKLPFGKGARFLHNSKFAGLIVGGWELSGNYSLFSGQFLTPLWSGPDMAGTASTGSLTPANVTRRPDVIRDPNMPADQRSTNRWFDTTAFTAPQPGQFGSAAKGIIKGPGANAWASGLSKVIPIKERVRVRAEITSTNILNHPNYSNPALVVNTAASAGVISGVGGVNGGATGDNPGVRVFRTSLRVDF